MAEKATLWLCLQTLRWFCCQWKKLPVCWVLPVQLLRRTRR